MNKLCLSHDFPVQLRDMRGGLYSVRLGPTGESIPERNPVIGWVQRTDTGGWTARIRWSSGRTRKVPTPPGGVSTRELAVRALLAARVDRRGRA